MFLSKSLKLMETYWLKNESQTYLCGNDITIADISGACELAQLLATDKATEINKYPKVQKWLNNMLSLPEMQEVHDKVIPMLKKSF